MHRRPPRAASFLMLLAAVVISCSGCSGTAADGEPHHPGGATEEPAAQDGWGLKEDTPSTARPTVRVAAVRDAFAGLQATLNETCTPANCEYLLNRVHRELMELDAAMKADPKGPGHFPEPIAWIEDLREALGGDTSFENLKKHQDLLTGTRDKINVWMQDHPDDYR